MSEIALKKLAAWRVHGLLVLRLALVVPILVGADLPSFAAGTTAELTSPSGADGDVGRTGGLNDGPRRLITVFVPGMQGTELRHGASGDLVWGRFADILFKTDRADDLGLPTQTSPLKARDGLVPGRVIRDLAVIPGIYRYDVYASLLRFLRSSGIRIGNIHSPEPGDEFYLFPYDWRLDVVQTAALLADRLDAVRRAHQSQGLRFNLVCHSNAAMIGRYLVKYGRRDVLKVMEEGGKVVPDYWGADYVQRLVLCGTANGGTVTAFRVFTCGVRKVFFGRRFGPRLIAAIPAAYFELPFCDPKPFVTTRGRPLDIEVFDPQVWLRNGWGIFRGSPDSSRVSFFEGCLKRAEAFHQCLHESASPPGHLEYYSIQARSRKTQEQIILRRYGTSWKPVFRRPVGHGVAQRRYRPRKVDGDGYATLKSQRFLSSDEKRVLKATFYFDGRHREIFRKKGVQEKVLELMRMGP